MAANLGTVTRFDLTTFGEVMLRLSVPVGSRLADARQLMVTPGGAEANVCAALAGLGRTCGWYGYLPDNALGELVLRRLKASGIDTSAVKRIPNIRLGTYYLEPAHPPRPTQVLYDRADSAATLMSENHMDWGYLLDTRVLHLTGITPALGQSCLDLVATAIARAKAAGVLVSFDVNYRGRLWSTPEARATLAPLVEEADILFCTKEDACRVLECSGNNSHILRELKRKSKAQYIILSLAGDGVLALDGDQVLHQAAVPVDIIIDRPGAGDALAAGVIDGLLDGDLRVGLERGVAMAAIALTQVGDMLITNRDEVNATLNGGSALISR